MYHSYGSSGYRLRNSRLQIIGFTLALFFVPLNWVFVTPAGSVVDKIVALGGVFASFWRIVLLLGLALSGVVCGFGLRRSDNGLATGLAVVGLFGTGLAFVVTFWPLLIAMALLWVAAQRRT